jgi:hypothetical protein
MYAEGGMKVTVRPSGTEPPARYCRTRRVGSARRHRHRALVRAMNEGWRVTLAISALAGNRRRWSCRSWFDREPRRLGERFLPELAQKLASGTADIEYPGGSIARGACGVTRAPRRRLKSRRTRQPELHAHADARGAPSRNWLKR